MKLMNLMRQAVLGFAVGLLGVLLVSGLAQAGDTVVLVKGARYSGKVTRDDVQGVEISVRGHESGLFEWRREDVLEVIYDGGKPDEYGLGRRSLAAGRLRDAVIYFEAALDGRHHELLTQYILAHMGRCLERLGEKDAAIERYEALRAKGALTRFLPEATERLAKLYGDPAKLEPLAAGIEKILPEGQALLVRALVEEKLGRSEKALELYERGVERAGRRTDASLEAELGAARCLSALGRHAEAERRARRVTDSARPGETPAGETLAEAYVLLGDALAARASTGDDYEDALLAYLRVPALYPGDAETEPRALRGAARCYRRIPGRESAARAERLLAMLKERYPDAARTASAAGARR